MKEINLDQLKKMVYGAKNIIHNNNKILIYPKGEKGECFRVGNCSREIYNEIKECWLDSLIVDKKLKNTAEKQKKRKYEEWTPEAIELLLEMYPDKKLRQELFKIMQDRFGKSVRSIRCKIHNMKRENTYESK
ncbi:MAG: hypothetical protein ACRCXX_07185 [Cetobacterium sp.]|uniref:hypothetical protein n=1 Tax=Cetobacterium sp. TaxID=2071632 RepID=UPI003F33C861